MIAATAEGEPASGRCAVTGEILPEAELVPLALLRPGIASLILADRPDLGSTALIGRAAVAAYRGRAVEELLREERGELTGLDREVVESLARQETIGRDTDLVFEDTRSLGDRLADHIAAFGSSWAFMLTFGLFLFVWMGTNLWLALRSEAFDPYPFILLNLVLSCLAAVQAPLIMMSQRRQEARDRLRAQNDYQVNLKAELEIRHLHEKIDHILNRQWERLAEIQRIQLELLEELTARREGRR